MSIQNLKARAKRLRSAISNVLNTSISVAQSLELVAHEENFPNWDAASASYKGIEAAPIEPLKSELPSTFTGSSLLTASLQFGTHIVAPSGSGKLLYSFHVLIDQLRLGKSAVVIDIGRSYFELVKAVGGTYCWVEAGGGLTTQKFGDIALIVYDLERYYYNRSSLDVEELDIASNIYSSDGFVLIDEAWSISRTISGFDAFINRVVDGGGSYCAVGQADSDFSAFAGCTVQRHQTVRLDRTFPI